MTKSSKKLVPGTRAYRAWYKLNKDKIDRNFKIWQRGLRAK